MEKPEKKEAKAIKATIEIREVKIGEKQLNQALFEQIAFAERVHRNFRSVPISHDSPLGNVWGKVWAKVENFPFQWYLIAEWKGTLWRIRYLEVLYGWKERKRELERQIQRPEDEIMELVKLIELAEKTFDSAPQIFLDV